MARWFKACQMVIRGISGEPVIRAISSSSSTTPGSAIKARQSGSNAANSEAIRHPDYTHGFSWHGLYHPAWRRSPRTLHPEWVSVILHALRWHQIQKEYHSLLRLLLPDSCGIQTVDDAREMGKFSYRMANVTHQKRSCVFVYCNFR